MRKENNYYDLSVSTNVCIKLLNNSSLAVTHELAKHQPDEIYLSTVVQLELYYGAYKSSRKEQNLGSSVCVMQCTGVIRDGTPI